MDTPRFVNEAELEYAKILDYYGCPGCTSRTPSCSSEDEEGRVTEAFTPDFYLPEQDLYLEVTVMKQSLVTRKNRKLRKLRQRLPGRSHQALLRARLRAHHRALRFAPRLLRLPDHGSGCQRSTRMMDERIGEVYLGADALAARVRELGVGDHARLRRP